MTLETKADLLLIWIRQNVGADCRRSVDPGRSPDWNKVGAGELFTLVAWLAKQGLVVHRGQRDRDPGCRSFTSWCNLTPKGVREAERLLQLRDGKLPRFDAAANGLVAAAMDDVPDYHVTLLEFMASERGLLLGRRLDAPTIEKAAAFMVDRRLATVHARSVGFRPQGALDPSYTLALTPLGVRCGDRQPIDVRSFVSNQDDTRPNTYNVYGGNNQIGHHNTQNNTIGFPPDQLAQFAEQVLAAAVTMDVPEPVRERLTDDAQALRREAEREEPQPGRLRRMVEGLQESLLQAGQDQAAQKLLEVAGGLLMGMAGG
ncbi:hypothetical protein ACPCTN_03150 [Streptomyces cinereoruber]|uniref:hypothetical protein n=1 Tax=Streptomyces cinereoruber TaxID=67260 RepID=UPI003C305580